MGEADGKITTIKEEDEQAWDAEGVKKKADDDPGQALCGRQTKGRSPPVRG